MNELQQLIDLTEKGLTQVATQLGTTLPQLWEIMIKQQYVEAVQAFTAFGIGLLLFIVVNKWYKSIDRREEKESGSTRDEVQLFLFCTVGVFMITLFSLIASFEGVGKLINPEYYAIKDIVYQISNLTNK